MKTALVIRLGALGDNIIATPLLRALKEDGFTVDVYCKNPEIFRHNPNVRKITVHDGTMKAEDLPAQYEKISKGYDKVVNLTGSIESSLVFAEGTPEFDWPKYIRHAKGNVNYYDQTMRMGGFAPEGRNGELYFSPEEERQARQYRKKYHDKFLIVWALSGSSFHKAWPYAEQVATAFLDKHPDTMTATVGDALSTLLEWSHKQAKSYSGLWPVRKSLIMTKYADLVIGPDTGILNAAACFDTPKILLLTGITPENISKHWNNVQVITPRGVECYPCHRLIYTRDACQLTPGTLATACASGIPAGQVYLCIEEVYQKWKEKRNGNTLHRGNDGLGRRPNGNYLGQPQKTQTV